LALIWLGSRESGGGRGRLDGSPSEGAARAPSLTRLLCGRAYLRPLTSKTCQLGPLIVVLAGPMGAMDDSWCEDLVAIAGLLLLYIGTSVWY